MSTQTWWFVSRASGIVAWSLAAASVLWGMALSTRALGKQPRAPWLLDLHRFLGALTVVFVGVHLLGLFLDQYAHFGLADLFVPFASTWKPQPVAWGIVAFYLLVAVEITSLLMKRLPKKLWHAIHLLSYVLYVTATVHLFLAGTDAGNLWLRSAAFVSMGGILFFLIYRFIGPGRAASVKSSGRPSSRSATTNRAPRSARPARPAHGHATPTDPADPTDPAGPADPAPDRTTTGVG
jgi:DMSO/TMAO reductase YedYZ heme-binding membrane subunit